MGSRCKDSSARSWLSFKLFGVLCTLFTMAEATHFKVGDEAYTYGSAVDILYGFNISDGILVRITEVRTGRNGTIGAYKVQEVLGRMQKLMTSLGNSFMNKCSIQRVRRSSTFGREFLLASKHLITKEQNSEASRRNKQGHRIGKITQGEVATNARSFAVRATAMTAQMASTSGSSAGGWRPKGRVSFTRTPSHSSNSRTSRGSTIVKQPEEDLSWINRFKNPTDRKQIKIWWAKTLKAGSSIPEYKKLDGAPLTENNHTDTWVIVRKGSVTGYEHTGMQIETYIHPRQSKTATKCYEIKTQNPLYYIIKPDGTLLVNKSKKKLKEELKKWLASQSVGSRRPSRATGSTSATQAAAAPASPAAAVPAGKPLPRGWEQHNTGGKTFYVHAGYGITTWGKPSILANGANQECYIIKGKIRTHYKIDANGNTILVSTLYDRRRLASRLARCSRRGTA